jgi:tetraspanin-13/31
MCGSFSCSKSTLVVLNIVYVMIAFLLIGVATYGKTSNMITSLHIVGGIVASGVFLLFIALAGLYGAIRHHQVTLFVYMVVLFLLFIIQFSVSCACLSVSEEDELNIASKAWGTIDDTTKFTAEKYFGCCGFNSNEYNTTESDGFDCGKIDKCMPVTNGSYSCPTCKERIKGKIGVAFSGSGGVGLFFSFTEIVGAFIAWRYRNLMDPKAPSPATGLYAEGNM